MPAAGGPRPSDRQHRTTQREIDLCSPVPGPHLAAATNPGQRVRASPSPEGVEVGGLGDWTLRAMIEGVETFTCGSEPSLDLSPKAQQLVWLFFDGSRGGLQQPRVEAAVPVPAGPVEADHGGPRNVDRVHPVVPEGLLVQDPCDLLLGACGVLCLTEPSKRPYFLGPVDELRRRPRMAECTMR
jgi:hypothetical protein